MFSGTFVFETSDSALGNYDRRCGRMARPLIRICCTTRRVRPATEGERRYIVQNHSRCSTRRRDVRLGSDQLTPRHASAGYSCPDVRCAQLDSATRHAHKLTTHWAAMPDVATASFSTRKDTNATSRCPQHRERGGDALRRRWEGRRTFNERWILRAFLRFVRQGLRRRPIRLDDRRSRHARRLRRRCGSCSAASFSARNHTKQTMSPCTRGHTAEAAA